MWGALLFLGCSFFVLGGFAFGLVLAALGLTETTRRTVPWKQLLLYGCLGVCLAAQFVVLAWKGHGQADADVSAAAAVPLQRMPYSLDDNGPSVRP